MYLYAFDIYALTRGGAPERLTKGIGAIDLDEAIDLMRTAIWMTYDLRVIGLRLAETSDPAAASKVWQVVWTAQGVTA